MFPWLILLFVCTPLVELFLLLRVGKAIGAPLTLGLVVVTGVLGAALARRQGIAAWSRAQAESAAGRLPGSQIVDALLILVAGVLLVIPGLLTDIFGFGLLIPATRRYAKRAAVDYFRGRIRVATPQDTPSVSFIDVDPVEPGSDEEESVR